MSSGDGASERSLAIHRWLPPERPTSVRAGRAERSGAEKLISSSPTSSQLDAEYHGIFASPGTVRPLAMSSIITFAANNDLFRKRKRVYRACEACKKRRVFHSPAQKEIDD